MDSNVNRWLRTESPKHTNLLTKLRERLEAGLEPQVERDSMGRERAIPPDTLPSGVPNRDWCRAFQRYSSGYQSLLVEERERAKLQILAHLKGHNSLSDDEFAAELKQLAVEALKELSTEDLAKEFLRRGMSLPVGEVIEDD